MFTKDKKEIILITLNLLSLLNPDILHYKYSICY